MNLSQVLPRLFVGSCPADADDISHLKTELRHHGDLEPSDRPRSRLPGLGLAPSVKLSVENWTSRCTELRSTITTGVTCWRSCPTACNPWTSC